MKHRYIDGLIIYIEIAFLKPFLFFLLLFLLHRDCAYLELSRIVGWSTNQYLSTFRDNEALRWHKDLSIKVLGFNRVFHRLTYLYRNRVIFLMR